MQLTLHEKAAAEQACALLRAHGGGRVVIVPDSDADGLSSAVLAWRVVERLGGTSSVLIPERGENVHGETVRQRLSAMNPDLIVVLDQGSRGGAICPQVPTVVIDHHVPEGVPEGAVLVSGADHPEQSCTSELTLEVLSAVADVSDLKWVAAIGLAGDLGVATAARITKLPSSTLSTAVALVNAANRSVTRDVGAAMGALLDATSPADIVKRRVPQADRLYEMREEVHREVARCAFAAPKFSGDFALVSFESAARVHPLLAIRWARRLPKYIVIAANSSYLPGRVNFSMRSSRQVNLLEVLRRFPLPSGEEVAHGHPQATGGSLKPRDFDVLLRAMGFVPEPLVLLTR